ncbi:MAG TPA: hypothetical protein VN033_14680 [Vulgatibacter sp.]|nr:hypothetical protein [Vulgatibacter sp.]
MSSALRVVGGVVVAVVVLWGGSLAHAEDPVPQDCGPCICSITEHSHWGETFTSAAPSPYAQDFPFPYGGFSGALQLDGGYMGLLTRNQRYGVYVETRLAFIQLDMSVEYMHSALKRVEHLLVMMAPAR